jgi:L-ribulose-5-phosphate 3-epimerase
MTRRDVLAGTFATALSAAAAPAPQFVKGICSVAFPKELPVGERITRAKDAGFDAIELTVGPDFPLDINHDDARRLADAADKSHIQIATLWVSEPLLQHPLNAPDPADRAKGAAVIRRGIEIAHDLNCGALLLYAVRLGRGAKLDVGSQETWDRYSAALKTVLPDAQRAKVLLNPENVWNKFLLSPLEMRSFVDQFQSPWVGAHFDVGNCLLYGYPEDWILTLGSRIKRVHMKDFRLAARGEAAHFADLLEGDVNWKAVMAALVKVGYRGFLSPEIEHNPAQPDQVKQISTALDKILAMA